MLKSGFLPKLSAQYGFQEIGGQSGFNSYRIGVQFPLFFNKTKGKVKAASIQTQLIEEKNKVNQIQFKNTFNTILSEYNQLQKSWNYYRTEALPLAKEQRNGTTLSYKEGGMDYIAFLQNMKDAIQLEINTWNVLSQYLIVKSN